MSLCTCSAHTLVFFFTWFLAYSQHQSVMVPKEVVLFRLPMNDREQVPCLERMLEYYDLAGWLPLISHALSFLIATACTWLAASHQAWSMTAIHPQSQITGHWNLSFFGSTDEPAQARAWFPVTRNSEDKTGSTLPNVLSQVSVSKEDHGLEERIWEGTKVTSEGGALVLFNELR